MTRLASAALAIAVFLAGTAAADITVGVRFTDKQRELIVQYYERDAREADHHKDGGKGKGKGKAKGDKGLPPGIAKNLERGKALPPGIAKTRLPDTLTRELPPPPKGHEIVVVDGRVVLVEIATQVVRDRLEELILR